MSAYVRPDALVIALDGPAASGKGTLAKKIAGQFGLPHLDTGLLYRAVGCGVLDHGGDPGNVAAAIEVAAKLDLAALDEARLRGATMGEAASRVAAIPEVRVVLLDLQRRFAAQPGGAVLDGRDIGTVICPDAKVKIFVTATPEVRAERRFKELAGRGEAVTFEDVLADIERRDARDSSRTTAPLVAAADAHLLDTTTLDIDAAFRAALDIIGRR
ncbi:(d)CMP kinase [Blastochloris viridis]|uniref:Cytidylate kinase n=1 Tax=Blastochloris viridis TaxID=1079 RepID=A0A0H5BPL0_BLAVI|nr:(d)CMP kinase [Blastochloris viridis]ALK10572.1 Cytidylate kinase [Blastochloris viridis]BAR99473.1 Cytidylate kinase [Blastochloris viridis]CUU43234.1 Cytidylate kinase [Blastochloris viridis]